MLFAYGVGNGALTRVEGEPPALKEAVWIDLFTPTGEEERRVEAAAGIEVPTREEMREIEPSSRLYTEAGTRYMTAVVVAHADVGLPKACAVTFILHGGRLITVRYDDPKPFSLFCARAARPDTIGGTGEAVFAALLDTIVDRIADIFEKVGDDLDMAARFIFAPGFDDHARSYKDDLRALGRKADLVSKGRESLISLARLLLFVATEVDGSAPLKEGLAAVRSMQRDVESLALHADYLNSKIQLMLDAIVGMVSIEQNNVMKIFAVLSVALMPPTLVGSIYGMNFKFMPELDQPWGYPAALFIMLLAGALPFFYFKWKRWL